MINISLCVVTNKCKVYGVQKISVLQEFHTSRPSEWLTQVFCSPGICRLDLRGQVLSTYSGIMDDLAKASFLTYCFTNMHKTYVNFISIWKMKMYNCNFKNLCLFSWANWLVELCFCLFFMFIYSIKIWKKKQQLLASVIFFSLCVPQCTLLQALTYILLQSWSMTHSSTI